MRTDSGARTRSLSLED